MRRDIASATIEIVVTELPEVQAVLNEWIDFLENAPRMGAERDVPEGACYIQMSDTMAKKMAEKLRRLASYNKMYRSGRHEK